MNITALTINGITIISIAIAFKKDKKKTEKALKVALKVSLKMLPMVIITILIIGLILGFIPKSTIINIVGERAGLKGIIAVASLGAVLHIPSIISFPLTASLLRAGASITSVAVFITTLTMIGIVTLPIEIRELGKKLAILRNGLSFIIAIVIGVLMGIIL